MEGQTWIRNSRHRTSGEYVIKVNIRRNSRKIQGAAAGEVSGHGAACDEERKYTAGMHISIVWMSPGFPENQPRERRDLMQPLVMEDTRKPCFSV